MGIPPIGAQVKTPRKLRNTLSYTPLLKLWRKHKLKKNFLQIILPITIFFLGVTLNACSGSGEISQEKAQRAIAETQQANAIVNTIVAATMNALPSETPPVNTSEPPLPAYDYSDWKGYHAPEGYFFNFPPRFNLEVRQGGEGDFVVLVAEGSPPNETSFSVNSFEQGSLIKVRDNTDLDDPVYTDVSHYGLTGFIIEGTVPGEGFGGGSVVYTAYFELGDLLIILDCPWNFCDRQEFDLILRSFKLD